MTMISAKKPEVRKDFFVMAGKSRENDLGFFVALKYGSKRFLSVSRINIFQKPTHFGISVVAFACQTFYNRGVKQGGGYERHRNS